MEAVLRDCDCFHPLYLDSDDHRDRRSPCELGKPEVSQCLANIETEFTRDLRRCHCNASCEEVSYNSVLSSSLWPARRTRSTSTSTGSGSTTESSRSSKSMSSFGEDLIHVSVYYNSFNTRFVVNNKVYEVMRRSARN